VGHDTRVTLGSRLWCKQYEPWDFQAEGAWQFGEFAGQPINAAMLALDAGYTFKDCPTRPRVSVGYDFASGDRSPNQGRVSTFSHLFPLGHAFLGYADVVGRQNIHAVHARVDTTPIKDVKAWVQVYSFWLAEDRDALYNAGGAPIRRDMTGSSGRYVGSEIDVVVKWQMNRHCALLAGYSHFWSGHFISGTGPGKDVDFVYVQYQFTF
jgi:hypothetical protein